MARPLRIEYPGAFYHVTSRGNEQKEIFKSQKDRERFLSYLESAAERYGAVIHAYCLIGNHYHLLLETPEGNLSQIMRHINGAYTTYFNVKRKRAGHLFQGRYKAILVEADSYATELSRYIHLNPVKAGMVARPEEYRWASYRSFIGEEESPKWLNARFILESFGDEGANAGKKYRRFVEDALGSDEQSPLQATIASIILGSTAFVEEISAAHVGAKQADRSVPALRALKGRPMLDEIVAAVRAVVGEDQGLLKKAGIYFCHRYSGKKLKEIGKLFGGSDAAASQASRRFALQAEKDRKLQKVIEKASERLGIVKS